MPVTGAGARPATPSRSLRDIALASGTDKEGKHFYAAHYERHLGHLRDKPIKLLEIGVGGYSNPTTGGNSLRMWKEYFPRAEIVGVDIVDKSALAEERITIVRGNQAESGFLAELARTRGPFDVIIDDGSHVSAHVIASFRGLFDSLAPGGIYVIEDLQTSYWERGYGGSSEQNPAGTSMAMLKELVDGLNYAEFDLGGYEPSRFDTGIVSVTFYHNLAFIQQGDNTEPSTTIPVHPHPDTMLRVKPPPPPPARPSSARVMFRRVVPRQIRAWLARATRRS